MFNFFNKNSKIKDIAHGLFTKIVSQARQPEFYEAWQVPDTLDGRFDLIILHVSLVADRFEAQLQDKNTAHNKNMAMLIRYLQEVLFDNMDMSLRELGVGDMSVGKKVKIMAEAYYGRKKAYQQIIRSSDMAPDFKNTFKEALSRNIYRDQKPDDGVLDDFVSYVNRQIECLESQSYEDFMSGNIVFTEVKQTNAR